MWGGSGLSGEVLLTETYIADKLNPLLAYSLPPYAVGETKGGRLFSRKIKSSFKVNKLILHKGMSVIDRLIIYLRPEFFGEEFNQQVSLQ